MPRPSRCSPPSCTPPFLRTTGAPQCSGPDRGKGGARGLLQVASCASLPDPFLQPCLA